MEEWLEGEGGVREGEVVWKINEEASKMLSLATYPEHLFG